MLRLWPAVGQPPGQPGKPESWVTAYPTGAGAGSDTLELIRLPPGGSLPHAPRDDTELVTYVREGAVAYEDSSSGQQVACAGEFAHCTCGPGSHWTTTNTSRTDWAHLFQISLVRPAAKRDPGRTQKRFVLAERRDKLCLVASHDGREGSLLLHGDALIFSAILSNGHHVVHELPRGSCVWLHVVEGEVALGDIVLVTGDGVGVVSERAVSMTAREDSEILLLHIAAPELPSFFSEAGR